MGKRTRQKALPVALGSDVYLNWKTDELTVTNFGHHSQQKAGMIPSSSPQQKAVPDKNKKEFPRLPKTATMSGSGSAKAANLKTKTTGISAQSTYITHKSWAEIALVSPRRDAPSPPPSTHLAFAVAAAERELSRQEQIRQRNHGRSKITEVTEDC